MYEVAVLKGHVFSGLQSVFSWQLRSCPLRLVSQWVLLGVSVRTADHIVGSAWCTHDANVSGCVLRKHRGFVYIAAQVYVMLINPVLCRSQVLSCNATDLTQAKTAARATNYNRVHHSFVHWSHLLDAR